VVFDGFVQRLLVLDAVFLSDIILPLDLEGPRSEFEAFFDLRNAFSVRKVRQGGEDLRSELIVRAVSCSIERQISAIGIIIALDDQRLICSF
jgi:hypothetical protein